MYPTDPASAPDEFSLFGPAAPTAPEKISKKSKKPSQPQKSRIARRGSSDDQPHHPAPVESSCVGSSRADAVIVHDQLPEIVSKSNPEKRRPYYKEPTPEEEWAKHPHWKPRKKTPGLKGCRAVEGAIAAVEDKLLAPGVIADLPRDENGKVYACDELVEAACAYIANGGTLSRFATAVGTYRQLLLKWLLKKPEWKAKYAAAKDEQVDAMAEDAVTIASEPVMVEDVFESYDGNGNLIRRDIKRSDATYARKLAVATRTDIIKKWAPEKYGEKIEVKTDSSMAAKILAARKRLGETKGDGED